MTKPKDIDPEFTRAVEMYADAVAQRHLYLAGSPEHRYDPGAHRVIADTLDIWLELSTKAIRERRWWRRVLHRFAQSHLSPRGISSNG